MVETYIFSTLANHFITKLYGISQENKYHKYQEDKLKYTVLGTWNIIYITGTS